MAGIDGLVPVGTTGEAPTLTPAERDRLHRDRRDHGRRGAAVPVASIPVVAGTGSNDTRASIEATRRAAALGADAALVVTPYYNKPDQRMLDAHFRAIADEGGLPIVVYNVPGRTGANVEADTFLRLAEHPRVVAVKEASGNIEQIAVICRDRPRDVAVLVGRRRGDARRPRDGRRRRRLRREQRDPGRDRARSSARGTRATRDGARRIHDRWLPLFRANFQGGPNPVPGEGRDARDGPAGRRRVRAPLLPLDTTRRASGSRRSCAASGCWATAAARRRRRGPARVAPGAAA